MAVQTLKQKKRIICGRNTFSIQLPQDNKNHCGMDCQQNGAPHGGLTMDEFKSI